jgi:predicted dehydrogenase
MALKVGFVGTGGIAKRHLGNTAKRDDIAMVGYADVALEKAQSAAEQYGGNAYADFRELYDREQPDVVVISTPPFAHGEIEEEAAMRGIHFFVEKPVAVNMELAKRVLTALENADIATQVGYMYRFSEALLRVRELLEGRAVAMVQAHYYMPGLPPPAWWPYMAKGGGQLVEQATHMLDLGRFLAGEVATVAGQTATVRNWTDVPADYQPEQMREFSEEFDIPDVTALILQYESGALGTLSCSIVPQGAWDAGFKLVADGLLVTIDGPDARWSGEEEGELKAGENWGEYVLYDLYDSVIAGSTQTAVPYIEGVRSLAISLAGYESVRRGGTAVGIRDVLGQV